MRTSPAEQTTARAAGDHPPAPDSTPAEPSTQADTARSLATALVLDVLAGGLGALLAAALDGSPTARLIGAVIGAVTASLITVVGKFLHLRVAAAVGITAIALVLTYTGGKAVEPLAGPDNMIFPPIPSLTDKRAKSDRDRDPPQVSAETTCERTLCIRVAPRKVECTPDSCEPVVVSNPGRRVLKIGKIEIIGSAASNLNRDQGCADLNLEPGRSCTIGLAHSGAQAGSATLVIHQNLRGPATRVKVTVPAKEVLTESPTAPGPDLTLSAAQLRCSVVRHGAPSGADSLTVFLSVLDIGREPIQRNVPFSLHSDTGLRGGGHSGISDGTAATGMQVELRSSDYGRTHRFTADADPKDEIVEENEKNNRLDIVVSVQDRPADWADQPCRTAE